DRTALHKAQQHLFRLGGHVADQQTIAGQRFGGPLGAGQSYLVQAERRGVECPGVERGLGQPTPPHLITPGQSPRRLGPGQGYQPVASFFFRTYAGSGLVIQCLARCQRTPRRASARRMASPLTSRDVSPSAYATSAAKGNVHRLVGLPKVRGLWGSSARTC